MMGWYLEHLSPARKPLFIDDVRGIQDPVEGRSEMRAPEEFSPQRRRRP